MGVNPQFDIDALKKGIGKAKENIQVFENAIEKERAQIKHYRYMIDSLEERQRDSKD